MIAVGPTSPFGMVEPLFSPMPDHEENSGFGTRYLPADPDTTAPDGSQVREWLEVAPYWPVWE